MKTVDSYLKYIKNKYLNTKEVLDQIEELRDSLNIKVEDYQSEGLKYQDAVEKAIKSEEGIEELFENLTTETKNVYLGLIYLFAQIISAFIILLIGFILYRPSKSTDYFINSALFGFSLIVHWVVISIMMFIPMLLFNIIPKTMILKYSYVTYRKNLFYSILGFLLLSTILFMINMFLVKELLWFVWFMLGILNAPLIVFFLYHLFKSKMFDVKDKNH